MNRRRFLGLGLGAAAGVSLGGCSRQLEATPAASTVAMTYAWLNVNRARYTEGKTVNGVSIDWSDRMPRLAALFRGTVKASVYGLGECEDWMAAGLAAAMGAQWRIIGCDDPQFNNNGWAYDSTKFEPVRVGGFWLPGSQSRRLATCALRHIATGRLLPLALVHASSGDPASRDEQIDAALDELEPYGLPWVLAADLNASSPATPDCTSPAPRTVLQCRGWQGPDVGLTFHNYTATDSLSLDYLGLNAEARNAGMVMRNFALIRTYPSLSSDHNVIRCSIDF